jgi:hypothetical protein
MESGFIVEVGAFTKTESLNPGAVAVFGTDVGVGVAAGFEELLPQAPKQTASAREAIEVPAIRITVPPVKSLIQPRKVHPVRLKDHECLVTRR